MPENVIITLIIATVIFFSPQWQCNVIKCNFFCSVLLSIAKVSIHTYCQAFVQTDQVAKYVANLNGLKRRKESKPCLVCFVEIFCSDPKRKLWNVISVALEVE